MATSGISARNGAIRSCADAGQGQVALRGVACAALPASPNNLSTKCETRSRRRRTARPCPPGFGRTTYRPESPAAAAKPNSPSCSASRQRPKGSARSGIAARISSPSATSFGTPNRARSSRFSAARHDRRRHEQARWSESGRRDVRRAARRSRTRAARRENAGRFAATGRDSCRTVPAEIRSAETSAPDGPCCCKRTVRVVDRLPIFHLVGGEAVARAQPLGAQCRSVPKAARVLLAIIASLQG